MHGSRLCPGRAVSVSWRIRGGQCSLAATNPPANAGGSPGNHGYRAADSGRSVAAASWSQKASISRRRRFPAALRVHRWRGTSRFVNRRAGESMDGSSSPRWGGEFARLAGVPGMAAFPGPGLQGGKAVAEEFLDGHAAAAAIVEGIVKRRKRLCRRRPEVLRALLGPGATPAAAEQARKQVPQGVEQTPGPVEEVSQEASPLRANRTARSKR